MLPLVSLCVDPDPLLSTMNQRSLVLCRFYLNHVSTHTQPTRFTTPLPYYFESSHSAYSRIEWLGVGLSQLQRRWVCPRALEAT